MNPYYQYLRARGIPHAHAVGMVANIDAESGGNPRARGSAGELGLFQHHGPRREGLMASTPNPYDWRAQMNYALAEPETQQYLAQKFTSPLEAAAWFTKNWERPKAEYAAKRVRDWRGEGLTAFEQRMMREIPGAGPALASVDEAADYPQGLGSVSAQGPAEGTMGAQAAPQQQPGTFERLAQHPLFNMGLGIMGANTGNYGAAGPAIGRGALAGMQNYGDMQQARAMQEFRRAQMQAAQQKARIEAEAVNSTEAWLQKLPPEIQEKVRANPDLAVEIAKRQIGLETPVKRYEYTKAGVLDTVTGEIKGGPTDGGSALPPGYKFDPDLAEVAAVDFDKALTLQEARRKDRMAGVSDQAVLRKEYQGLTTDFRTIERGVRALPDLLTAAETRNSKAADLALVVQLAKAMDPGSVVREGEVYTIQRQGGLWDAISGYLNYVQGKGQLTNAMRRDLAETAMSYYKAAREAALGHRKHYGRIAEKTGVEPWVITGDEPEELSLPAPKKPDPGTPGPGFVPEQSKSWWRW